MPNDKKKFSPEDLKIISQTAIECYLAERQAKLKDAKDRRFHNTKLLLRHYRNFKAHVGEEKIQDDLDITFGDILFGVDDDNELVESITRTKQRTAIILQHIDLMLNFYQISCEKSCKPENMRHWNILRDMYLGDDTEDMTAEDLAEKYEVDRRTVYKDINSAARVLSVLFFGIDGVQT